MLLLVIAEYVFYNQNRKINYLIDPANNESVTRMVELEKEIKEAQEKKKKGDDDEEDIQISLSKNQSKLTSI
jgi:hypothetical protein